MHGHRYDIRIEVAGVQLPHDEWVAPCLNIRVIDDPPAQFPQPAKRTHRKTMGLWICPECLKRGIETKLRGLAVRLHKDKHARGEL
jgi:hypothetical protein